MLHQGMAKYPVELAVIERQRVTVTSLELDAATSPLSCCGFCPFDLRLGEIDPNDLSWRCAGSNTHSDRTGTASAIKYRQPRLEIRQKKSTVRLKRSLGHKVRSVLSVAWRIGLGLHCLSVYDSERNSSARGFIARPLQR